MCRALLILVLLLVEYQCSQWWLQTSYQQLTEDNYQNYLGSSQHLIVKFYTPWCTWCQRLSNTYEQLHQHYIQHNKAILITGVNCQEQEVLCQALSIRGYPTIQYFQPYNSNTYNTFNNNNRDLSTLITWVDNNYQTITNHTHLPSSSTNHSKLFTIFNDMVEIYEKSQYDHSVHFKQLQTISHRLAGYRGVIHHQYYNWTHCFFSFTLGAIMGVFSALMLFTYQRRNNRFKYK